MSNNKQNSDDNIFHHINYDAIIIDMNEIEQKSQEPKPIKNSHTRRKSLSEKLIYKMKRESIKINVVSPTVHEPMYIINKTTESTPIVNNTSQTSSIQ